MMVEGSNIPCCEKDCWLYWSMDQTSLLLNVRQAAAMVAVQCSWQLWAKPGMALAFVPEAQQGVPQNARLQARKANFALVALQLPAALQQARKGGLSWRYAG